MSAAVGDSTLALGVRLPDSGAESQAQGIPPLWDWEHPNISQDETYRIKHPSMHRANKHVTEAGNPEVRDTLRFKSMVKDHKPD